jgi:hypothetical protein
MRQALSVQHHRSLEIEIGIEALADCSDFDFDRDPDFDDRDSLVWGGVSLRVPAAPYGFETVPGRRGGCLFSCDASPSAQNPLPKPTGQ